MKALNKGRDGAPRSAVYLLAGDLISRGLGAAETTCTITEIGEPLQYNSHALADRKVITRNRYKEYYKLEKLLNTYRVGNIKRTVPSLLAFV